MRSRYSDYGGWSVASLEDWCKKPGTIKVDTRTLEISTVNHKPKPGALQVHTSTLEVSEFLKDHMRCPKTGHQLTHLSLQRCPQCNHHGGSIGHATTDMLSEILCTHPDVKKVKEGNNADYLIESK